MLQNNFGRDLVELVHHCRTHTKHRSSRARALCEWPRAHWVSGEGEWALIAQCGVLTVRLHPSWESATSERADLDKRGCCHQCRHDHAVARLVQ